MLTLVTTFLACGALLLAALVGLFVVEVIAALVLPICNPATRMNKSARGRLALLVPAHNESAGILPTLIDIKLQMNSGDRLLVVADNCDDDTASIAKSVGAETIERREPNRRGKGYALDFGVKYLSQDPPETIIVIDADCRIANGAIELLAITCATTGRPVQSLDLMTAPEEASVNIRVAEFAWRVKNWVRPLGLMGLRLPCQLMGTGMAFPWKVARLANFASDSIVEDIKLGLELTKLGYAPVYCPSARVMSRFPLSVEGRKSQRKRWEEGHINLILKTVPRYICGAIALRNLSLLVLTLDMAVPPLSLLILLLVATIGITAVAALLGVSIVPLQICLASILTLSLAIFLAWLKYGRDILPARAISSIPSYMAGKIPNYRRLLSRETVSEWTRTDRSTKK